MSATHFVVGPPGTGKTTYLSRQARRAAEAYGPDSVVIASLTRAAAAEIAGRDTGIPPDAVGTLHAHAYRALDRPALAEAGDGIRAWNTAHPGHAISGSHRQLEDAPDAGPGDGSAGDDVHAQVMALRAGMVPRERWTLAQRSHDADWTRWKTETGRLDFTDLIERVLAEGRAHPFAPEVLLLDEAQDFSRLELELVRCWSRHAGTTVLCGDPRQCQPGDTMIGTAVGPVRFDELDPAQHRILSFDRRAGVILGKRSPQTFRKAERRYSGPLLTITAGQRATRCTPDHRWPIRWKLRMPHLNVVYLMRRGDRWRVGWCQLFNGRTGTLHLGVRANHEKADETWVLSVHQSKREASIAESIAAARFGLPLVMFEAKPGTGHYDRAALDAIFAALHPKEQAFRAERCLREHGRDPGLPLLTREAQYAKNGKRHMPFVHAANLLPEAMTVAVDRDGRSVDWSDFAVVSGDWSGTVYSLDVQPHHTYIADGLITGNCLYSWRGTDPGALMGLAGDTEPRVLSQSHRVPRAVHAAAEAWVSRLSDHRDFIYAPRDVAGAIMQTELSLRNGERLAEHISGLLEEHDGTVMVLASCGYMLAPLIDALRDTGTPFHNPYRTNDGRWNPMRGAGRLRAYLAADERVHGAAARAWTWDDLRRWTEPLAAKDALARGAKARIEHACMPNRYGETRAHDEVALETVLELLGIAPGSMRHPALHGDAEWWFAHLRASEKRKHEFALQVLRKGGPGALAAEPRVIVGSVHSVKGGEATHVVLAPDLSPQGYWHGWHAGGEGRDSIVRMLYVALTRAREAVTLLAPGGAEHVHGELREACAAGEAVAA